MRLKYIKEQVKKKISASGGRIKRQIRKVSSVLLCASMVTCSMPLSAFTAFAAGNDEPDYVYEIDNSSFVKAIKEAVAEDNSLDKELKFLGDAADEYDELFDPDGTLYELKKPASPSDAKRDRNIELRTFVRIEGDIPLDEDYVIDGDEEVLFLIANKSDEETSVKICVDEKETEVISVPSVGDIEVSEEDLESIKRGFSGGAGSPDGSAPEGNGVRRGSKDEKDDTADIVIEKPDRSERPDGNASKDSDVHIDEDRPGKDNRGDSKDKDENGSVPDKKDTGSHNEDGRTDRDDQKTDKGNGRTDKNDNSSGKDNNRSDNAGQGSDKEKADSDKGSSGSDNHSKDSAGKSDNAGSSSDRQNGDNASGKDNEGRNRGGSAGSSDSGTSGKAEQKSASVSVHNGNLLAASIASSSNAIKASSSDADTASPSDAAKLIEGTIYDPVWFENKGAVAFATTTKDLGLEDTDTVIFTASDGDVVVTVELPAGAVPAGAELVVTVHDEDSDEYADAIALIEELDADQISYKSRNADDEEGISTLSSEGEDEEAAGSFKFSAGDEQDVESGWISLDISFYADGEEVEPSDTAVVTIDASEVPEISVGTIESYEVWHMEETDEGVEPVLVAEMQNSYDVADGVAEFTVESFSEFEFHYTCSEGGWAGFGTNLLDQKGKTISATVSSDYTISSGRYTTTVGMPYTFIAEEFSKVFTPTKATCSFLYATVTDPNCGDTEHTFDVWPDEEQVGANELYGSEENPVMSIKIDGTAAAENPNYGSGVTINSKTWHFTLTYEDGDSVTIPIYGNADGANDNGGKYCPKYLEINLYFEARYEAVLNLGNGNGTYSDGDYTGSSTSGGDALRYGTGSLDDYADADGKVTIHLPSDNDLDNEFTVVDAVGTEGEEGYQPAVTIELGKEQAYDYKLRGWINIATGEYYDVSEGSAAAEIDLSDYNVFYADWIGADYDRGSSSDDGLRDDIVSTANFVTFRLFDFNELFNLYSVSLGQDGTAGETWTDSGFLYSEPLLGNTDLTPIVDSFIFQNNGTTRANSYVLSHATPRRWNLWTSNTVWLNYPEYNFVLDAGEYWNVTSPDSTILGMLFDTKEESLGVHYVGDADYLFWIDENGYYTYDSAKSGAAYNQSEKRFYVYEDNSHSFFPYNGHTDSMTSSNGFTNYWFGMNMEVNFYLPTATKTGSEENKINQVNGNDMVFNFSGDDDIMIFIDGEMVCDMSGIHSTSYSSINFSTNTATISVRLDNDGNPITDGSVKYSENNDLNLSAGYHTMQIFYMERGGSASNLKIQFNLVPTWMYETGTVKTLTADKVWEDYNHEVIDPEDLPDDLEVEIALFDALQEAGEDSFGYTKNGSKYTVDYTDDKEIEHIYVYDEAGPSLTYTDSGVTTVYNKLSSDGDKILDDDGYVIAWLEGETLHIRIDQQTLGSENEWSYEWEMLDPDGDYEFLELSESDSYETEITDEELGTHTYWSIIGEKEIESELKTGTNYQIILTDAAEQDEEKEIGDTKETEGWVVIANKDGTVTSGKAVFSQHATLVHVDDNEDGTINYYIGTYGVTSESAINDLGSGALWYAQDAGDVQFKIDEDGNLVLAEGFYLCCLLDGARYYLALSDDKGSLVVTANEERADVFFYDPLGELRVYLDEDEAKDDADDRVIINAYDGTVSLAESEFEADENDIRIYTLSDIEDSGTAYTATNIITPFRKTVDTDGDGKYGDNGKSVCIGDTLSYEISYFNDNEESAAVKITDELDKGLTYVEGSASDGGIYDSETHTLTWIIEGVSSQEGGSVTFKATVNDYALFTYVDNTATVSVNNQEEIETNTVSNPVDGKDVDSDGDGEYGDNGKSINVGDTLTYKIQYYNADEEAADITIIDKLDEGLTFKQLTGENAAYGEYDQSSHTITWVIPNVEADTGGDVTFEATVNENALEKQEVENTASVKVGDNDVSWTNTVHNPLPHKDVDVNPDDGLNYGDNGVPVKAGDTLTYKIDYHNSYDKKVTVTITDELDPGLTFVSASDNGTYDEGTRTITWVIDGVKANADGFVTFEAVVNNTAMEKKEVRNRASVQINGDPAIDTNEVYNPVEQKDVDVDPSDGLKYGDNGVSVRVGDTLTYKIEYFNDTDDPVTITIKDTLDSCLNFESADNDGEYEQSTRTITWIIDSVEPHQGGYVTFTATVNSNARNRTVSNTAEVQIGSHSAVKTNTVSNPGPGSSSGGRSGGRSGGGSGGSSGGSGVGGPGDSGGSGDGDIWDLLPMPQTGQGWAMLFGAIVLAVSAMVLIALLWYKRRSARDQQS